MGITVHVEMNRRPDDTGTPSGGKKTAAGDASRILGVPMAGSITRRQRRGGQRHGARVELLLHCVFRLLRHLDELIEVLLHARFLGKRIESSLAIRRNRKAACGQARRRLWDL